MAAATSGWSMHAQKSPPSSRPNRAWRWHESAHIAWEKRPTVAGIRTSRCADVRPAGGCTHATGCGSSGAGCSRADVQRSPQQQRRSLELRTLGSRTEHNEKPPPSGGAAASTPSRSSAAGPPPPVGRPAAAAARRRHGPPPRQSPAPPAQEGCVRRVQAHRFIVQRDVPLFIATAASRCAPQRASNAPPPAARGGASRRDHPPSSRAKPKVAARVGAREQEDVGAAQRSRAVM